MQVREEIGKIVSDLFIDLVGTAPFEDDVIEEIDKLESLISQVLEEKAMEAFDLAAKHGTLPVPNPFGKTIKVERHNQVIQEMRGIFKAAILKGEK